MAITNEGICKLCGKKRKLTFEHVPPNKAFNSETVVNYFLKDINDTAPMIDESEISEKNIYGKDNQRGGGGYYLCGDCNNNTGSWYMDEYVDLAHAFHSIIKTSNLSVGQS